MIKKLVFAFCFVSFFASAQTIPNSFKIINNRHPEKESFYIASITKANMEKFRLQDKEVTLKFDNGFDCIMTSAKQLFLNGNNINATSYELEFTKDYSLPNFNILESGQLMAVYTSKIKQSKNTTK